MRRKRREFTAPSSYFTFPCRLVDSPTYADRRESELDLAAADIDNVTPALTDV
jgi:hypothetical protein